MKTLLALSLTLCAASAIAAAQTAPASATVLVTVLQTSHPLQPADLSPQMGRKSVTVEQFRAATGPLQLYVVIDGDTGASFTQREDAVRKFIQGLPADSEVGLAMLKNSDADIVAPLSRDHAAVAAAIPPLTGNANISPSPFASLTVLMKNWPDQPGTRREMYVFSNGIQHMGGSNDIKNPVIKTALEEAQRDGIVIWGMSVPGSGNATGTGTGGNQPALREQGAGNIAAPKSSNKAVGTTKSVGGGNTMNSPADTGKMDRISGQGNLRFLVEGSGGVWDFPDGTLIGPTDDLLQAALSHLVENQYWLTVALPPGTPAGLAPLHLDVKVDGAKVALPAMAMVK